MVWCGVSPRRHHTARPPAASPSTGERGWRCSRLSHARTKNISLRHHLSPSPPSLFLTNPYNHTHTHITKTRVQSSQKPSPTVSSGSPLWLRRMASDSRELRSTTVSLPQEPAPDLSKPEPELEWRGADVGKADEEVG